MPDSQILDTGAPGDQPKDPFLNVSKLPSEPEPQTPDISKLPDFAGEIKPPLASTEDPYNAVFRAPHDEDTYNELLRNSTSDEDLLYNLYGQTVVDAIKRLYAPDTTSPKAVAAAQNAIAVSELTGFKVSPAAYLENPDAYNEVLFGTGHLREKIVMGLAGMMPSIVEGAPTGAAAEGVVDTAGAIAAAWRAWRSGLWRLPLGIAGYEAEENANALIRSRIEGKPFSETKPYGLHDLVPEQAGEGAKAVVDLLDMFGKSKAMHAGFGGLETLWDAMAYDKVSQVLPSQKMYVSAADIRSHFGAGTEGNAGDYYDILQKLNLSPGQIKDAAKYGLDVEVPLSRVVGSMDAPWFARLKNFFRITPGREVTEVAGGEPDARLHVSGELEAPAVSTGGEGGPPEDGAAKPSVGAVVSETKPALPESEGLATALSESEAVSQPVQMQSSKDSIGYLQSPGFAKEWAPSGKDHDALLPYIDSIDSASGKYDVPANIIKALVWKESNNSPDIVDDKKAGVSGDPGAMPSITEKAMAKGSEDGLKLQQNIDGGTKYLRDLYDRFGDWGKAVAAYNSSEASKLFAENPDAKVEDAPNYLADVEPVLDAAEKFGNGGEPAGAATRVNAWDRKERETPQDRNGRFIAANTKPTVGGQGENVELAETLKNRFGNTKVVFKEGEWDPFNNRRGIPGNQRMVYHAIRAKNNFEVLRPDERGAIWFRSDRTDAERSAGKGAAIIPAYLNIENPLEIEPTDNMTIGAAIDQAKARGNDGVILRLENGDYIYAVFSPDQVISPLIPGKFDTSGPDIPRRPWRSFSGQSRGFGDGEQSLQPGSIQPASVAAGTDRSIAVAFKQIKLKPVQIVGLHFNNYVDLAVLAQKWRNPYYEELRYIFVKDGVIVDHEGITCMHPGSSLAWMGDFYQYMEHLKQRIKVLGATDLCMLHNHPLGDVEASFADLWITRQISKAIPQYRAHIIINGGKYWYIEDPYENDGEPKTLPNLPKDWTDPILHPSIPHELLGKDTDTLGHIASWAKALTKDRNMPVLIYMGTDDRVRGLQEIHPQTFIDVTVMRNRMPQKLVDFGSVRAVAAIPDKCTEEMLDAARYYVKANVLWGGVGFNEGGPFYINVEDEKREYFGGLLSETMPGHSIR